MKKYRVKDSVLEYKIVGQGKTILFLHGWGMDHRIMSGCFEPVFLKHEQEYRRIYIDLPGMGTSKAGEAIKSSDDILELLHLFAKEIIGESFLLVGESYGGYLARGFVHHFSDMVQGMILLCPLVYPGYRSGKVEPHTIVKKDEGFLKILTQEEFDCFTYMNVMLTKPVWERFSMDILPAIREQNHYFLEQVLDGAFSFPVDQLTEPFTKPCLILVGKMDTEVGYKDQFDLLNIYLRATYCAFDEAGHNLQIEQPELFENMVKQWLINVENDGDF